MDASPGGARVAAFATTQSKRMATTTVIASGRSFVPQGEVIDLTESPPPSPPPRLFYRPPLTASAGRHGGGDEPLAKRQRVAGPTTPFLGLPTAISTTPGVIKPESPARTFYDCFKIYVNPMIIARLLKTPGVIGEDGLSQRVFRYCWDLKHLRAECTRTKGYLSPGYCEALSLEIASFVATLKEPASPPTVIETSLQQQQTGPQRPLTPIQDQVRPSIEAPIPVTATLPPRNRLPITKGPVSPVSYRSHARASAWKYRQSPKGTKKIKPLHSSARDKKSRVVLGRRRPYLTADVRRTIGLGSTRLVRLSASDLVQQQERRQHAYHVDFTFDEIECARRIIRLRQNKPEATSKNALRELGKYIRKDPANLPALVDELSSRKELARRDKVSISNFLQDVSDKETHNLGGPRALCLQIDELDKQLEAVRASRIPSLLFGREIEGNRGFGRMRKLANFTNEFRKAREDDLEMQAEWTNCAGDIATISWVSPDSFLCGTTTHSDAHNQQYNKPGNLLLCSLSQGVLQAYPQHRIERPLVQNGENSTEAMRETQDPWLYTSVVSSDYDIKNDLAFTSSFDKTVKVWKVVKTPVQQPSEARHGADKSRRAQVPARMKELATWPHGGNVNFVAACKNGSGLVATAADVPQQAIRVYHVRGDASNSPYYTLSGTRTWNEDDLNTQATQKWAYYPATMQWGLAPEVQHLLLVGYSPRTMTGDEEDIPIEKRNSGEICLWDCRTGQRCKVLTASTQNVFEVAWHPTQPSFIVATSPAGHPDDSVRTQIRIFRPSDDPTMELAFNEVQCLDCPALDINELTIKPCSMSFCYVTAAATDGNVYVWDTARGDKPIHRLMHGTPLEGDASEEHYDRERDDTGVKFTAWGISPDRFYTGGSDGVVKVWNVRNRRKPLVRVLLEVPAPVSSGSFSPDKSKLAIGDATGRVFLLSLENSDEPNANFVDIPKMPGQLVLPLAARSIRRPMVYRRHATPPPPSGIATPIENSRLGHQMATQYVLSGQLRNSGLRCVGMVKGPNYASLGLYREELHNEGDGTAPLLAYADREQQENTRMYTEGRRIRTLNSPAVVGSFSEAQAHHDSNRARDLDLTTLPETTQIELALAGIKIDDPIEEQAWDFDYEEE